MIHDAKLTYEKHINYIVTKANKSLGFIKRSCSQFDNIKVIKVLYCSYVRSILEYCSQIWDPQFDVYINRLESIQRKFMHYLQFKCKIYDDTYKSRCRRHHILPLHVRRNIADISLLTKIAQSQVDSPYLLSKITLKVPTRSSRQNNLLHVPLSSTNYRQNSFFIRTANNFNRLVDCPEYDLFNSSINFYNKTITSQWFDATSQLSH